MNEYRVVFTTEAQAGLSEIMDYIGQDSPLNAKIFVDRLIDEIEKTLSIFPNSMSVITIGNQTMRRYPYKKYNAFYEVIEADKIVNILYILSGKQNAENIIE